MSQRDAQPAQQPAEPLHYWPLHRIARAIREGALSPRDVTLHQLSRIEALDPVLHAFVTLTADRALERADRAGRALSAGQAPGPLHGVPIALKDLCHTRGVRTTAGTRVLRDFVPDDDACVVERLEAAGAIVLGKLAMTEGAFAAHHPDVVPPVNPWNPALWTGISSSGSGVATAAGLCFASLGTDTGGSIRFPSAANGIVGIKPTYGRVSRRGIVTLSASLDHVGPMTRSVRDAAIVLDVIAGRDPGDPTCLREPPPETAAVLDRWEAEAGSLRGVRIGVDERYATQGVDAQIADAVLAAREPLRDAGASLVPCRVPDVEPALGAWVRIAAPEIAHSHTAWFPGHEDDYGPELRAAIELGRSLPATAYVEALEELQRFRAALADLFDEIDVLLCPALGVALPAGANLSDPATAGADVALRFTAPYDVSGSPSITLPCGARDDGGPIGLQLVGRHREEARLVCVARAFERSAPLFEQHPPL